LREDGPLGPDVELSLFVVTTPLLYLLRDGNLLARLTSSSLVGLLFVTYFDITLTQTESIQRRFVTISEPLLLLLLLLLHPLYLSPHKVSRFP
jgi:hypothetical protein